MTKDTGIVPITDLFLRPNYLFALQFRQGFIFGRVIRSRTVKFKPYKVIDSAGNDVLIAPSSYATVGRLRAYDPRNTQDDLLFLKTNLDNGFAWIMHGSVGVKPAGIRVYARYPETEDLWGRFPAVVPANASAGDNMSYIDSLSSPYEKPTNFQEIIITPNQHVGFEYYNEDNRTQFKVDPSLNIIFSIYWFQVLKQSNNASLIGKIADRTLNSAFFTAGFGSTPIEYTADLQKDWGETTISLDNAVALSKRS